MRILKLFRNIILTVLLSYGVAYYISDGNVNLVSQHQKIDTVDELDAHIHRALNVPADERPESIVIDYKGESPGVSADDLKEALSSGGYNILSIGGFTASARKIVLEPEYLTTTIDFMYTDTNDDQIYIDSEVQRISKDIISEGMSDYEKVEAINQYISHNVTYYEDPEKIGQSVRTLLEDGTGVCTAYALTAARMLDDAGIENIVIGGDGFDGSNWIPHAWNKVQVDGHWYNLDVTWNHPRTTSGMHNEYRYFLVSDAYVADTHRPIADNLPPATNKQYENMYLNDFSGIEFDND